MRILGQFDACREFCGPGRSSRQIGIAASQTAARRHFLHARHLL